MKILADQQIPCVHRVFSEFGEVILRDGRDITLREARGADVLLVRSVTRVDADLLAGSTVRFVASATSGIDHVDTDYLKQAGIGFASAPGCNAQAVVEYVLSSLFILAAQYEFKLTDKVVGIIGCGQVGSRLAQALSVMGVQCLSNDPPLKEITGDDKYCELMDVLQADVISLHVPLTISGRHPTRRLVNAQFLAQMRPGAVLINTSRGGVVDEGALKQALRQRHFPVVLDVWNNEPAIDPELLASVAMGTPHIAGYTSDARLRATALIYRRLCEHLRVSGAWRPEAELAHAPVKEIGIDAGTGTLDGLEMAILTHYDVRSDAAALRESVPMPAQAAICYFDELRKNYPVRREFAATTVRISDGKLAGMLGSLGFMVVNH
jgi:erythronate-4-phosphate dehydrogenase